MTQEQRLDEEMECMIRWHDPFCCNVLWHVSRLWDRLSNVRYPGWDRNASVKAFHTEAAAMIATLESGGF